MILHFLFSQFTASFLALLKLGERAILSLDGCSMAFELGFVMGCFGHVGLLGALIGNGLIGNGLGGSGFDDAVKDVAEENVALVVQNKVGIDRVQRVSKSTCGREYA